jgi:single-strand DNA-binding protein
MASFNRVILVGNLTRDPELRYLQSGMAVTDIGLAVNDRRKNATGEWIEETTFIDVTLWGRTAEIAGEYLSKGSSTLIEGRLKTDSWDDKQTGQKRSKLKVVCERMQLLGGRGQGGGEGGGARPAARQQSQNARNNAFSQAAPPDDAFDASPAEPSGGDDIPF